jgi:threonine/homoserine/homoserine lactone efflux protein
LLKLIRILGLPGHEPSIASKLYNVKVISTIWPYRYSLATYYLALAGVGRNLATDRPTPSTLAHQRDFRGPPLQVGERSCGDIHIIYCSAIVGINFAAFLGVSLFVILSPGPDTALTIRNTLLGGRGGGIATAFGVVTGLATWTVASSAGLAALLVASQPLFLAVRLAGAAYLVFLGLQALRAALFTKGELRELAAARATVRLKRSVAYRQGLLSNLSNPKIVVFFLSLLPQFIDRGQASFERLLLLGLIFCTITLSWLTLYAVVVARVGDFLRRDRVRRALEAVTGLALVGLGLKLVADRR